MIMKALSLELWAFAFLGRKEMYNKNIVSVFTNQMALQPKDIYEDYSVTLKYLLRVIDCNHPSYDFIVRLASFATSSELSATQKKSADNIINHFHENGFFNDIPDIWDIIEFCFKNNLKRIKIDSFYGYLEDVGFRIDSNILLGFVDWRKLARQENKNETERLIPVVKLMKDVDKNIRKSMLNSGTILSEQYIKEYNEVLEDVKND